jgi:hypothetical protein
VVNPPSPPEPGRDARALIKHGQTIHDATVREREAAAEEAAAPPQRRQLARSAYEALRTDIARAQLTKMPLDRVKDITEGRIRLGLIERAGYSTVGAVLDAGSRLRYIQGVGPESATKAVAAARQLLNAMIGETRVRFDPDDRTAAQTRLLAALRLYEEAKRDVLTNVPGLEALAADLTSALTAAQPAASKLRMFFTG